jgi:oxygen-independent coproporphyrinogen-3 oxidase
MIEMLMCDFRIDAGAITRDFDITPEALHALLSQTARAFDGHLHLDEGGLFIPSAARPLTRMIARDIDAYEMDEQGHSSAI